MRSTLRIGTWLLALTVTPILILVSTASDCYLDNQMDFGCEIRLLSPFLLAAAAITLAGLVLSRFATNRAANLALWAYLLLGPFYFGYRIARKAYWTAFSSRLGGNAEALLVLALLVALALVLRILWSKRAKAESAIGFLAVAGVLLVIHESYKVSTRAVTRDVSASLLEGVVASTQVRATELGYSAPRPNIYHLILDGYQTEMFEHTTPVAERDKILDGFVYFPKNITVYGRTRFAIPSSFLGTPFDYQSSQYAYLAGAFSSKTSFLHALREARYQTLGFHATPGLEGAPEPLFDRSIRFGEFVVAEDPNSPRLYRNLWLVSAMPDVVSSLFMSEKEMRDLKSGSVLPAPALIKSAMGFRQFLGIEARLPAKSRYTYLYLMMPHPPMVLDEGCALTTATGGATESDQYLGQILCAKTVLREFCQALKRLGRYEESLIVVHADHGFYAKVIDGQLRDYAVLNDLNPELASGHTDECATLRSRALLLIKPPKSEAGQGCTVSPRESTLLDVAPTMLQAVGVDSTVDYYGQSLLEPDPISTTRDRYYHFYDFIRVNGVRHLAGEMTRWTIEGGKAKKDRTIPLRHTLDE